MRFTPRRAACALLLLNASACTSPSQPAQGAVVRVQGVRVTPQVVQLLGIGDTSRVVATISPPDATDQAVTWESTDSSVASVSATGLITANAVGTGVFVTALTHDGSHQASVNVSVNP